MTATVSPVAYWLCVVIGLGGCAAACAAARRHAGRWAAVVASSLGVVLLVDAGSYTAALVLDGSWSARTSLPLSLCDVAVLVGAAACLWLVPVLVELTYFWGLAGTLQGVLTPDLSVSFPHLVFWQYIVGHLGIVFAALFLVVGLRITPGRHAVARVFAVSLAYTALVGTADGLTGANYMFLRRPPGEWTLLRLLGPWPWYVLSASVVALVLFTALDAPFWAGRRSAPATPTGRDESGAPAGRAPAPGRA
ncbi:MAG: TIGR02206 family membrane protein [Acidimicrobiales bacterium]